MADLLSWLGGQVEGGFAQLNPFDNGATFDSVQKRRQREQQVAQQQTPQSPQRQVSYGIPGAQRPLSSQASSVPRLSVADISRRSVAKPMNTLDEFNGLDVHGQRKKIADLQGLAGRTEFNSSEDVRNAQWAKQRLQEIEQRGAKKNGNPLTFAQDLAGGFVAPAKQVVDSTIDTLNQQRRGAQVAKLYDAGQIDKGQFLGAAQNILKNSIDRRIEQTNDGTLVGRQANPIEFGGKFGREGAEAALAYSPVGAGYRAAANQSIKSALPLLAKEGAAYTAASTGNDLIQGRGITPESVLMNAAASFGGAAVGAGAAKAMPVVRNAKTFGITPPTGLSGDELNAASRITRAQRGLIDNHSLTDTDFALYASAEKKLGFNPGTPQGTHAVASALDAHRSFDFEVNKRRMATMDAFQKASQFTQDKLIPGGTLKNGSNKPNIPGVQEESIKLYRGINDVNEKQASPDRSVYYADTKDYAGTYGDNVAEKQIKGRVLTDSDHHSYDEINQELRKAVAKHLPPEKLNKLTGYERAELDSWLNHTLTGEHLSRQFQKPMPEFIKSAFDDLGIDYIRIPGKRFPSNVTLENGVEAGHRTEIIEIPKPKNSSAKIDATTPERTAELRKAIDARIYETNPELFSTEATGRAFNDTGTSSIPRLHVDDLQRYFGNTEGIPSKYKRTTGKADIDELAARAGYDDIDAFVESIQRELDTRSGLRNNQRQLVELRNDPRILKEAEDALKADKAKYSADETYEPSKRDLQSWDKMNRQNDESTIARVMRALNPDDNLQYKNLNPIEKKLYQGEKAKQRINNLTSRAFVEKSSSEVSSAPAKQGNTTLQDRSQRKPASRTTQETSNRSVQQLGQQTPSPDNTAQIDRTYNDDTLDIDTKQYVNDMSKAQNDAQKGNNSLSAKTRDFKEKFIDDLSPIEDRLNKAIKDSASIDPKDHITYQLDRSRRAEGIMNAYVKDNGLDKIVQNVDSPKEFDQYLIARHAKELGDDIATGRNVAKDAALVRQLDGKYGAAAKELYTYNQKLLDTSVEYGLISKEAAVKLKKQYPEYVPFNRIFNEDELANLYGGSGKGDASLSSQGVVKKIKGSNRAIASPLNSIIDKTRVVVEQGERNRAAQTLADYRKLPGNPFNLKEIPKGETIGNRSTISYMDKGVKRTFETDKEIADAAKNMTRQEIGLWGRIAAVPARVIRGGATTVNVGFAGANVVKDVEGAAINSRHPFRIADPKSLGKALAAALNHNGKYYQELMREGVSGTSFDMYRNPLKSNVEEIRSQKNVVTRAAYNARHPGQWYRTLENTIGRSEDFGRALQYYSNKSGFENEYGKGSKEARVLAADQARNNSTNFFRHGSYGKGINTAIPYWNAGVQGARIGIKRIKERPVQTVAKIGFVIAAPSAMIASNNYANEKNRKVMEEIPQHEKDGNIIIVGPNAKKNDDTGRWEGVYKIPVPPQHIGIHKSIQDAVRAGITGKSMDALADIGRVIEDYTTVNPTSVKETANRYIPQGLKLIAEPMTNTNFFTGNKIVPDSQKNLPAKDQFNEYTSGTAKIAGQITNISPRQIDNAIRTGMGGAGQNLVHILDTGLAATGIIDKKDVKGQNAVDSITRRFYGAASINPSEKAEETFGELKKKVTETDAYKNASQYDKGRMLNRLEGDISAIAWHVSGKNDSDDKLTKKQKGLLVDGFNAGTYTNLDSSSGVSVNKAIGKEYKDTLNRYDSMEDDERKKWFYTENDAEYKYSLAKYENDKANGTLSAAQDISTKKSLRKEKVGSSYTKDVRDLYSLSKADLADYLAEDDGKTDKKKLAEDLLKYDRELYDSGASSTMKFKYGFGSAGKGGRKGGKKGSGAAEAKSNIALTRELNKIGVPKTASAQAPKQGGAQMKKTPLRKYTVQKAGTSKAPIKISTSKAQA